MPRLPIQYQVLLTSCLVLAGTAVTSHDDVWDYVIVGAGPSGLQMGYFLEQVGRNYIILEKANTSGSFFHTYPRHDKLISINKRFTGKTNHEFNLRHDWNSLLSDDETMLFRHFSREFFPHREEMARYLETFSRHWRLNIRYNTEIVDIQKLEDDIRNQFRLRDHSGLRYSCRTLIIGTGLWKPSVPQFTGVELTDGYETVSVNPEDFEGKTVLILGHGNAAFETAQAIYGSATLVHLLGRSRMRLSWETHYVGDVRGVNNNLLDTYQLKSMDGILEGDIKDIRLEREGARVRATRQREIPVDNFPLRMTYDRVIRCLGFHFDASIFNSSLPSVMSEDGLVSKFPRLGPDYQSAPVPGMYVVGAAAHSLDYRRSAGGFIHGFRYTVRALHHLLEWREHSVPWPSIIRPVSQLLPVIVKRLNEASGIYQMFGVLCDVILLREDKQTIEYIEEFPLELLPEISSVTGHPVSRHIAITLQYGSNYSGPGKDVFHESRASGFAHHAHKSNFLHPVLYYYTQQITAEVYQTKPPDWLLPRPSRLHHVLEDFLTEWSRDVTHILPLRRFLEFCLGTSLQNHFAEDCYMIQLTHQNAPPTCEHYAMGLTLSNTFVSELRKI